MELEGIKKSSVEEGNVLGALVAVAQSPSGGCSTGSGSAGPLLGRSSMGIGVQCYSSSTGSGSSVSYHPYPQHLSNNNNCGRNNRRRSLPPSPFLTEDGFDHHHRQKIVSGSHPHQHPQQQQQQQQQQHSNLKHSRKMRRYNKKLSKRLRRATQAAPNNNNEFLMQEHDPLFHLDQDFDHATEEDSNSDEQNHQNANGRGDSSRSRTHRSIQLYSSSPEDDEEDFLVKDFSNAYEVVHAERLYNMSKHQLIHEYQLMEERVELLENKLRSALLERRGLSGDGSGGGDPGEIFNRPDDTDDGAHLFGNINKKPNHVKSEAIPVPSNHHIISNSSHLTSNLLSSSGASANEDDNDMSLSHQSSSQSSLPDDEEERFQYICT